MVKDPIGLEVTQEVAQIALLETKEKKCRKFEDGFNDHIRAHVTGFFHDDFSEILTCALNVERVKKKKYERKERRRVRKIPVNQLLSAPE